jgi:hypothetical protein
MRIPFGEEHQKKAGCCNILPLRNKPNYCFSLFTAETEVQLSII